MEVEYTYYKTHKELNLEVYLAPNLYLDPTLTSLQSRSFEKIKSPGPSCSKAWYC